MNHFQWKVGPPRSIGSIDSLLGRVVLIGGGDARATQPESQLWHIWANNNIYFIPEYCNSDSSVENELIN